MTTAELVAAVRAALAKATPAPWCATGNDISSGEGYDYREIPNGTADAALIAAAPGWLAELCDALDDLELVPAESRMRMERDIALDRAEAAEHAVHDLETRLMRADVRASGAEREVARLNLPENRGIGDAEIVAALQERDQLRTVLEESVVIIDAALGPAPGERRGHAVAGPEER